MAQVPFPSMVEGPVVNVDPVAESNHGSEQELCFLHFSDEILSIIFGFVPPRDLLLCTTRTCHRFSVLLQSDSFWKYHPLVVATAPNMDTCNVISETALEQRKQQHNQHGRQYLNKFQLQLYCLYRASRVLDSTLGHGPAFLQPKSVLAHPLHVLPLSSSSSRYYVAVCVASSTDHADTETIDNVLEQGNPPPFSHRHHNNNDDDDNNGTNATRNALHRFTLTELLGRITANNFQLNAHHENARWWSSAPGNPDDSEVLLFSTYFRYCILTELWLKPLRDPFTRMVVYTSRKIIIRAYLLEPDHHPLNTQEPHSTGSRRENLFCGPHPCAFLLATADATPAAVSMVDPMMADRRRRRASAAAGKTTIDALLQDQIPVYESPEYDIVADSDNLQKFHFPAQGIIANVITITLIGKNFEQFRGSGYYTCVERVDCLGIPLNESSLEYNTI